MANRLNHGFTLIELMLVMIIASVTGMGALQGWQQRQHLADSVNKVRQFLLALRSDASWNNRDHLLKIQPGIGWCVSSDLNHAEESVCAPWTDVQLVDATTGMGFYGRRDVARAGHITFRNAAGARRVIVSSRGRIRICQPDEKECVP